MASRVVMPKLSDTMEEGKILRWLKQEGDRVETGQTLAEVETDKATVEMEAYTNGVLRKIVAAPGETVAIGALIAVIGTPDEDISALLASDAPAVARVPGTAKSPEPKAESRPSLEPVKSPEPRAESRPSLEPAKSP
jgi:pyruvate dehydrogenase E2 component (dihydrolipoamide acetyltransferase)